MRLFRSCGSVLELLNLRDRALLRMDGKSDFVSGLYILQERDRVDGVAHCHRVHETFDLFVVDDDLLTLDIKSLETHADAP